LEIPLASGDASMPGGAFGIWMCAPVPAVPVGSWHPSHCRQFALRSVAVEPVNRRGLVRPGSSLELGPNPYHLSMLTRMAMLEVYRVKVIKVANVMHSCAVDYAVSPECADRTAGQAKALDVNQATISRDLGNLCVVCIN
jgi:hypothetical protein